MKLLLILSVMLLTAATGFPQTPNKAEVVALNGTDVYYEVYGEGEPLLLLHGYTLSSKSWLPYVSGYADDFEVYLIDLKGHGRSGPFREKLSIASAASDVGALIRHLGLKRVRAIGFSYGGDVLFQLALLHPGVVESMISIGACGSWNARDYPEFLQFLSYDNRDNLAWMDEHQESEAQIKNILDEMPNYSVSVSDEELKSIKAKTLIVLGDQDDQIPLKAVSRVRKHLPESYLWVLSNTGHGAHEKENKRAFLKMSKEFFGGGWGQAK
jgi:pimeloyl-ACP methyl ester carboxylesterase